MEGCEKWKKMKELCVKEMSVERNMKGVVKDGKMGKDCMEWMVGGMVEG